MKSIGDVFDEHKLHPESKSAAPDGNPCGPNTRGVLSRRSVHAAYVISIGKESNKLEEVEHQEIHDLDKVLQTYSDPEADPWFVLVVPILKLIPRAKLANIASVTQRSVRRYGMGDGSRRRKRVRRSCEQLGIMRAHSWAGIFGMTLRLRRLSREIAINVAQ